MINRALWLALFGRGGAPTTRYFRRNEGTTDYATIPEVTLAGDFVIEFDILPVNNTMHILSNRDGSDRLFQSASENKIELETQRGTTRFLGELSANVVNTMKLSRVSNNMTLILNGGSLPISEGAVNSGVLILNTLFGIRGEGTSVPSLSGILANLKIYDNGTLIRDYPLDEPKGTNVIVNRAAELGSELWSYPITLDGSLSQYGRLGGSYGDVLPVNSGFLVTVSWENMTGKLVGLIGDNTQNITNSVVNHSGSLEYLTTSFTSGRAVLQDGDGGTTADSITVSVKQADGYGTIVNGNDEDKGLFTKQANGDWLGQELLAQPIDLFTTWLATGLTTVEGPSSFRCSGVGGVYYNVMSAGTMYRVVSDLSGNITPLQIKNSNGAGAATDIVADVTLGESVVDYLADAAGIYLRGTTNYSTVIIHRLSVKEVLKVA